MRKKLLIIFSVIGVILIVLDLLLLHGGLFSIIGVGCIVTGISLAIAKKNPWLHVFAGWSLYAAVVFGVLFVSPIIALFFMLIFAVLVFFTIKSRKDN